MAKSVINGSNKNYISTPTGITIIGRTKQYNTISERNKDSSNAYVKFALVEDATSDETVTKGSAIYYHNDDNSWTKLFETESMDNEALLDSIVSSVETINNNLISIHNNLRSNNNSITSINSDILSLKNKKYTINNVSPDTNGNFSITANVIGAATNDHRHNDLMPLHPSSIELYPNEGSNHGGFIDFHFNGQNEKDKTSRIIESAEGVIEIAAENGIIWRRKVISGINNISELSVSVGSVICYHNKLKSNGSAIVPAGYLIANGAEVRKDLFPDLYDVIGDTYNTSTTTIDKFKLPNHSSSAMDGTIVLIKY